MKITRETEKVDGDSRTPKFTTYEAEEAYKLGRMHGAAASEAYHLTGGSNPSPPLGHGRPCVRQSAFIFCMAALFAFFLRVFSEVFRELVR